MLHTYSLIIIFYKYSYNNVCIIYVIFIYICTIYYKILFAQDIYIDRSNYRKLKL